MACSLRSDQWSCSELAKGATVCADMAGMDLINPESLTKDELLQSIKEAKALMNNPQALVPRFLTPKQEIQESDTLPAAPEEISAMLAKPVAPGTESSLPPDVEPMVESSEPQAASTGKDGTTDSGNKRSEPPVSEKLSPEKKVSRTESPTQPIGATGDSHVKRTLEFGDDGATEGKHVQKSPENFAGTGGTTDGNNAELLALALAKIQDLEAKLNVAISARPAPPPMPTSSNVTPRASKASVASPAPSTSGPRSSVGADDFDENQEGGEERPETDGEDMIIMPSGKAVMSHDALRMRLRRMCEIKAKTKKCHVDTATHEQYVRGGEGREWLEIAFSESLEKLGDDKNCHKKLRAEFCARVIVIRERMESKEQETTGFWYTEEKLKKSGEYTAEAIKSIIAYCSRFPTALVRKWKYDTSVREFFVETTTKQTIKQSELLRQQEVSDLGEQVRAEPIAAPSAPLSLVDESGLTPEPEKMGEKVLPDLVKFMDSIHGRIMQCHKLSGPIEIEAGETPAGQELLKDFKRINESLNINFKLLAEIKAEVSLQEDATTSEELRKKIAAAKEKAKKPCAELIAIEPRQKLLLADLKRSKGKPELPDAGPKPKAEPKNAPKGPKGPKGKGKAKPSANGDDQ